MLENSSDSAGVPAHSRSPSWIFSRWRPEVSWYIHAIATERTLHIVDISDSIFRLLCVMVLLLHYLDALHGEISERAGKGLVPCGLHGLSKWVSLVSARITGGTGMSLTAVVRLRHCSCSWHP